MSREPTDVPSYRQRDAVGRAPRGETCWKGNLPLQGGRRGVGLGRSVFFFVICQREGEGADSVGTRKAAQLSRHRFPQTLMLGKPMTRGPFQQFRLIIYFSEKKGGNRFLQKALTPICICIFIWHNVLQFEELSLPTEHQGCTPPTGNFPRWLDSMALTLRTYSPHKPCFPCNSVGTES